MINSFHSDINGGKINLYDKIFKNQLEKQSKNDRSSVSFEKSVYLSPQKSSNLSTQAKPQPRKSKLFIAKNFVKSLFPFLKSMKNLKNEKALEKPSNKDIFYYSFRKFLRDDISIDELMYAKNFPNKYFNSKQAEFREISSHNKNELQKLGKSKTFSLSKQMQKNQAQKNFSSLWAAIKERIDYRKKIKNELEQINPYYLISTSEEKFFSNFYSASNDYIDKIRNKDLTSCSTNKKFYNNDLKSLKLKEFLLKRPKPNISGKIHRKTSNEKNELYKSFFNNNADLFVSQLESEREEKEHEDLKFADKLSASRKLNRNNEQTNYQNTLTIKSIQKKINLENSQMILSEIYDANELLKAKKKNYVKKTFIQRSNSKKKPSYNESFKDARDRMQYEKKLTEYLHQKPNIHKILKKYTTEVSPLITEIHNVDNFNDNNMSETIRNKNNNAFLKVKYENREEKLRKIKQKKESTYFTIKRNENSKTFEANRSDNNNEERSFEYDSDNQSITEATLDNLYKESMIIQKRILEKKSDGVGKRLKQFIKLKTISREINRVNANKLKQL